MTDTTDHSLANLRAFQSADAKFRNGDGISDDELRILIAGYKRASDALRRIWNPEYRLTENDIASKLRSLESFHDARRRDR